MSQVNRNLRVFAIGCVFLAAFGVSCSKFNDPPFDPASGHPDDFFPTHPAEYRASASSCAECHGSDFSGGISAVSCSSASFEGQSCHAGGPGSGGGNHPADWRSSHTSTNPSQASTCATCHDNPDNSLSPNCFNNSLCHGAQGSQHPSGWLDSHDSTSQSQASSCAACHQKNAGTPGCFNNTLCHGAEDDD